MKKYLVFILNLFFLGITFASAADFDITGKNVVLYNLNDNMILYEEKASEKVPIASLTKIMTSVVAIENIDDLNEYVIIKTDDFIGTDGYSKAGFKVGDKVTYLDLLYGILLPSGADAVNAIINNTLKDDFVSEMNNTAKKIGMSDSSFANGVGKDDENNYSTAKDLAKLLNYALKDETFYKIFTTKEYTASNGLKLQSTISHYQNFLKVDEIKGAKSGFTKKAGRCLASIATLNNVNYLLVVLNSSTKEPYNAVQDTITIYDYYNNNYSYQTILDSSVDIKTIPIKWSKEKEYNITYDEEVSKYLKNEENKNLTYEYEGVDVIKYNTSKGTKLGTVKVFNDKNDLLFESSVYLNKDITYYNIPLFISIILVIVFIILLCVKKMKKTRKRIKLKKSII